MTGRPASGQAAAGRVLVIEDDPDIARAIRAVFESGGLDVLAAADGQAGLRAFHAGRPGLVVLDIGLPVLDGWAVLDRIRDFSEVPVLMLTSHGLEAEKVRGLRAGADDYVTKPFSNAELLARVAALLRRSKPAPDVPEVYNDGLVRVAFADNEASIADRPVSLTPTEFRLLAALVRHPARILSPDQLLAQAWQDPTGIGPDRVKFTIMRLRRKLGQHGGGPIEAVRGFGYRYLPPR
ncbi:MAG TPA: response regulator transcription factor [Streptosporangiaceae bacterium]|nr:response regulator transcription factor [Streptosporangiaceae bacterium]